MSALRSFLSEKGRAAQFQARRLSPSARALPDFIVIGAQKSGTSSMFSYLRQHPQIVRPIFKEIYYFDRHYARGQRWYERNFPSRGTMARLDDRHGHRHLTFEATATYIFDANAPRRICQDLESRRFVALLRNPVDRAVSAYWHARRMGREGRTLMDAIEADVARYEEDIRFERKQGPRPTGAPPHPTYLRRGIYHEAIARWLSYFDRDNLLVVPSETLFTDPATAMERVFAFLDLAPIGGIDYAPQNVGGYDARDEEARAFLRRFYAPHNETLQRICGISFPW